VTLLIVIAACFSIFVVAGAAILIWLIRRFSRY
jgi:hypothetical protein